MDRRPPTVLVLVDPKNNYYFLSIAFRSAPSLTVWTGKVEGFKLGAIPTCTTRAPPCRVRRRVNATGGVHVYRNFPAVRSRPMDNRSDGPPACRLRGSAGP